MRYNVVECAPVEGSIWHEKVDQWYAIEDTQTGELFKTRYLKDTKANDVCEVMNEKNGDFTRKIKPKRSQSPPKVSKVSRFISNELFVGQKLPKLDHRTKKTLSTLEKSALSSVTE